MRVRVWAESLDDASVCRIYARLRAPSREHAEKVIEAWLALPDDEQREATERMRAELINIAKRAIRS